MSSHRATAAERPHAAGRSILGATLIGAIAPALWASLALFTSATGAVPPFLLMALTFGIAFACAVLRWLVLTLRDGAAALAFLRQPWPVWLTGIAGLYGYHFFYFLALDHAPPANASLVCYLWPLLLVLFSALLPGERLYWQHIAGGLLGLAGAAVLIAARLGAGDAGDDLIGYGAALACAFTWSIYSVLSRRLGKAPTDLIGAFCGVTAVLGLLSHLAFEDTLWPAGAAEWAAVVALGLGPVGLAFFVWDYGVKHGDIRALGAISYGSPLLSTLLLILFGRTAPSATIAVACLLIVGGAVLAARDLYLKR
jgi:drug/metabolite transporter (DMT)-like permease